MTVFGVSDTQSRRGCVAVAPVDGGTEAVNVKTEPEHGVRLVELDVFRQNSALFSRDAYTKVQIVRKVRLVRQGETHERDELRLPDETEKTVSEALIAEIKALREEVAGLRQEMQAMRLLEHKPETAPEPAETPRRWWKWGKR